MELSNFQELIVERQHLLERIKELEEENVELRKRLGEHVMHVAQEPKAMQKLSLLEKVNLFRSLFKGIEDVFARQDDSFTSHSFVGLALFVSIVPKQL